MVTPMANQGVLVDIGKILQEMELKRQEDKEQQERTLQVYMQQMQQQLQPFQREAKKREHSRCQPSQKKETPKIPKFYGGCDPKIYLDWEAQVEQIFNENHVKDQTQVDLVVLGFLKYAKIWWHKVCKNYDQGPPVASWMDIKTLMCARFVPPFYRKELLLELQRLHQGPMCVSEYFKELESQMFRVGIKERLNYSFGPSICHEISLWSSSFSLSQFGPHFLKTDSIWSSPLTLTKGF